MWSYLCEEEHAGAGARFLPGWHGVAHAGGWEVWHELDPCLSLLVFLGVAYYGMHAVTAIVLWSVGEQGGGVSP